MQEALLHTIWKYKLLSKNLFIGTKGEAIEIVYVGEHNQHSGPDFFSAKVLINNVLLVGNLEIHVKTSDWLKHNHQADRAYDNLVLHVVYEHDVELPQNQKFNVPVIELKQFINPALINQYALLESSKQAIPCGKSITSVPQIILNSWYDRLAVSRIEKKTEHVKVIFNACHQNYEETLYILLCRNFGFKINTEPFEHLAKSVSYNSIKKYSNQPLVVESILFGTAGLLDELFENQYPKLLQNEFEFYKHKQPVATLKKEQWKFSKTRPVNFPTIRISQLAALLCKSQSLYHLLETKPSIVELTSFFEVEASEYWQTHFKFDSESEKSSKVLGETAIHILIINTVVVFLFFMAEHQSKTDYIDYALDLLTKLPSEINAKTKEFSALGLKTTSAIESQAQIELLDNFCSTKACLHCHIGQALLKGQA